MDRDLKPIRHPGVPGQKRIVSSTPTVVVDDFRQRVIDAVYPWGVVKPKEPTDQQILDSIRSMHNQRRQPASRRNLVDI